MSTSAPLADAARAVLAAPFASPESRTLAAQVLADAHFTAPEAPVMSTPDPILAGAARALTDPDATEATRTLCTRVLVGGRMPPAIGPACPAALTPLVTAQLALHALARVPEATVPLLLAVLADASPAASALIDGDDPPEPRARRQAHRVRVQRLVPDEVLLGVVRPGAPLAAAMAPLSLTDARALAFDLLALASTNDDADPSPEAA